MNKLPNHFTTFSMQGVTCARRSRLASRMSCPRVLPWCVPRLLPVPPDAVVATERREQLHKDFIYALPPADRAERTINIRKF